MKNLRKNKAFVFIDGSNFYFKLKVLTSRLKGDYSLLDFNFQEFARWLVWPADLVETRYYLGVINKKGGDKKSIEMFLNQQILFTNLKKQGIRLVFGKLIRHPDKTFHEKGVDVRIAVDMIKYARKNKYDLAYLVSSDTDLVPAIKEVQSIGKKVCYVGNFRKYSFDLAEIADTIKLLKPRDIKQFLT